MRDTKLEWALQMASVTARRSTCLRRHVGAILLDAQYRVLSTGYNGVAKGLPHCNEPRDFSTSVNGIVNCMVGATSGYPHACPGALSPSGANLDGCEAIHAEQNALLQCPAVDRIHTCVTTTSPCMTCVKLLMNTGCVRIVFLEPYAHTDAAALWRRSDPNRQWTHVSCDLPVRALRMAR